MKTTLLRGVAAISAAATLSLGLAAPAAAETGFPNRTIELLVPCQDNACDKGPITKLNINP
ncbi:hypothetical protein ACQ858_05240 [Variovorax ureilyticus]|uniref:hypothetical protein n=1 Tax=Variovorax ureilyticus TaxID=1836198 RepID=UPI003D67AF6E